MIQNWKIIKFDKVKWFQYDEYVDRSIPNIFSVGLDKEIVPTESSITQENAN